MGQHYVWSQAATLKITGVCPKEGTQNDNRNWTNDGRLAIICWRHHVFIHLYIYREWYDHIWSHKPCSGNLPYLEQRTHKKKTMVSYGFLWFPMVSYGFLSICPQTSFNPSSPSGTNTGRCVPTATSRCSEREQCAAATSFLRWPLVKGTVQLCSMDWFKGKFTGKPHI